MLLLLVQGAGRALLGIAAKKRAHCALVLLKARKNKRTQVSQSGKNTITIKADIMMHIHPLGRHGSSHRGGGVDAVVADAGQRRLGQAITLESAHQIRSATIKSINQINQINQDRQTENTPLLSLVLLLQLARGRGCDGRLDQERLPQHGG